MSKKNHKNDSKALKKDDKTDIKTSENQQKNKQTDETVNIHYPAYKTSEGFDKNLIIVIICFAIIFSIVILEKKFYKKNHKESDTQNQTYSIQIDSEPVNFTPASDTPVKKSDSNQSKISLTKDEPKIQENSTSENIEEKPFVVIVEHDPKKERESLPKTAYDTTSAYEQLSDITIEFDSTLELTKKHKAYLTEKLDAAKKLGYSNNVVIYGYANSENDEQENIKNSLDLANKTAAFLSKNGYIAVSIKGLGSEDMTSESQTRTVSIQLLQYR